MTGGARKSSARIQTPTMNKPGIRKNEKKTGINGEKGMWICVRPETRSPRFGPPSVQPEPVVVLAAEALLGLESAKLMDGPGSAKLMDGPEPAPPKQEEGQINKIGEINWGHSPHL